MVVGEHFLRRDYAGGVARGLDIVSLGGVSYCSLYGSHQMLMS